MEKEKKVAKENGAANADSDKKKISLEVELPASDDLIVCRVCGHKNPKSAGLCEMCSNYIF